MLEGIHFSYDGVKSVDMGLINVTIDGGMFEETFLSKRDISEKKINGRDKPYFQRIDRLPNEFKLTFAFEHGYDEKRLREVARWLNQDYYKPFYTIDNPNRIFYCMLVDNSNLIHNGSKQGYIDLTMRCDSPYSYTPEFTKDNLEFNNTKNKISVLEDTFSYDMGVSDNIEIDENGNLKINKSNVNWLSFENMKWSEII